MTIQILVNFGYSYMEGIPRARKSVHCNVHINFGVVVDPEFITIRNVMCNIM